MVVVGAREVDQTWQNRRRHRTVTMSNLASVKRFERAHRTDTIGALQAFDEALGVLNPDEANRAIRSDRPVLFP
jgi:hypothetical protein